MIIGIVYTEDGTGIGSRYIAEHGGGRATGW